jgi:hypothetical protein
MPDVTPSRNSTRLHPKRSRATTLAALDGSRVAVHIVVAGREQFLRGEACYGFDSELGKLLRVHVDGSEESLEIVIAEATWNGQILPGHAVGSDYLIRLGC